MEERPWQSWGKGKDGLQAVHLARLLRPFGLKSKQVRIGSERIRQYPTALLREAMARYTPPAPVTRVTPVTASDPCHVNPNGSTSVTGVTGVTGLEGCHGSVPVVAPGLGADEDPDVYHHEGVDYMAGDRLPNGQAVLEVIGGIGILSRRPPGSSS